MRYNHNPITRLIAILHRRTHVYFDRQLKPYGVTFTQFRILAFVSHHDGIRQEDIRSFIDADKGAVAHAVKGLEESGLLGRERDESDRRAYVIRTTEEGEQFLEQFSRIAERWNDQVVAGLSEEESAVAEDLLQRMLDNTCELVDDECKG